MEKNVRKSEKRNGRATVVGSPIPGSVGAAPMTMKHKVPGEGHSDILPEPSILPASKQPPDTRLPQPPTPLAMSANSTRLQVSFPASEGSRASREAWGLSSHRKPPQSRCARQRQGIHSCPPAASGPALALQEADHTSLTVSRVQ